jgi:hypothetical protein
MTPIVPNFTTLKGTVPRDLEHEFLHESTSSGSLIIPLAPFQSYFRNGARGFEGAPPVSIKKKKNDTGGR